MKTKRLALTKYQRNSSKTVRPIFIYRYVISSTTVYFWVNFQMSGNSPILFQSQRKVQLKRYQTIDQYLCCPWSPKSSNVASITNSYHTFPLNSTIYNSVSSEASQPPHSFCTFSMIFIKRWRVETKSTLCIWTLQKRLTRLIISLC